MGTKNLYENGPNPFLVFVFFNLVFFVFVFCCCCFSHSGCQPEKTTLHGGQSSSWSGEQGKENKRKSLAARMV